MVGDGVKLYQYVIRRLVLILFVLLGVSVIVFYLARGFPEAFDPVAPYINPKMTAEEIQEVRRLHGFDQPLQIQYFFWLRDALQGDFGVTGVWANSQPATTVFFRGFPLTVQLSIAAIFLTVSLGIPLGIISAVKNNRLPDHISRIIALTGYSTPSYWFGFILQLVFFAYFIQWGLPHLPSSGAINPALEGSVPRIVGMPVLDGLLAADLRYTVDALAHLVLPAFSLAFISLGFLARIVRASMLEVLRQDYITLARSKGLRERVVLYRHAMKNALAPAVTLTGIFFAALLGGAMITEFVFNWPGVGRLSLLAVNNGDSNFLLLYTLVLAVIVVMANLVVDIVYVYLDPRIKY
jgi:peptide/nickel transport system permease protein